MAAIELDTRFRWTAEQAAQLQDAARTLPESWRIEMKGIEPAAGFVANVEGGPDGSWRTAFSVTEVGAAIFWLQMFALRPEPQTEPELLL